MPDVNRLSKAVQSRGADLGVLIDDDASRCVFVDEQGEPLKPDFTVIFEYGLPRDVQLRESALADYAKSWHALGDHDDFDGHRRV